MIKDWLTRLTDDIKKDPDSNIGKLLLIVDNEIEQLKGSLQQVEDWRNINNAQGTTLDFMGENINQPRGKASDEIYRVMIRGKEALNLSDGTTNKIIEVLSSALDCQPSAINVFSLRETDKYVFGLKEEFSIDDARLVDEAYTFQEQGESGDILTYLLGATYSRFYEERSEPAAIVIKKVPLEALNKVGMTPKQFVQIVQRATAGGVRAASINLEGTFRFSSTLNSVEVSDMGFSSDGIDGGTLGAVFSSDTETELPI